MSIENIFLIELRKVISERYRGYQTEVAQAIGMKSPTFSNMLCGRRGTDEETRRKISKYVGIDYDHLLREHGLSVTDNSQSIGEVAATGKARIEINNQSNNQPSTSQYAVTLTEKEHEAFILYRKVGNERLLDKCIAQMRKVESIMDW